jgi:large-conductance mechanosensitive channel
VNENSHETINVDSNSINTKQVVKVIFLIVLGVGGFYFANFHNGLSIENGDWGTFGDYFGGILNPVVAAFAFYLIAKTYELQKRELEATRSLLGVSTKAQKDQIKLAALTALLNSNSTKIGLLQSEMISLLQGKPNGPIDQSTGQPQLWILTRRSEIQGDISNLTEKNNKLEEEIRDFLERKIE